MSRYNVYSEELTGEIQIVTKQSQDGQTHFGLRIFQESPECLHFTEDDDDRSAVTYWVKFVDREVRTPGFQSKRVCCHDFKTMSDIFYHAYQLLLEKAEQLDKSKEHEIAY